MSLTLALNTALSALSVNQKSLAVLSQNIANANNPEYSRKVMNQQAVYLQGTGGAGVSITDIGRKVDDYLQKAVVSQGSDYGRTEVVANYTEQLQVLLGKPGSQNSIYSDVTSFFNSLQQLSQTPENASLRVGAVDAGKSLARNMAALANGIYDMQYSVDQGISQSLGTVNKDLQEIYTLNASISSNKLLGRSTSELEDRRDTMLREVSNYIDVQTYMQSNGVMNVFTAGGYSLVDDNVYALSYNGANSADFFANNTPVSALNIFRLDENGNKIQPPTALATAGVGSQVTTALNGGKIKGLLDLRDRQLPDVLAKLDMLAATLRDSINAIHNDGVAFPGANSYTGTRGVSADDYSQWGGQIRIAVLDQNGKPIPSNYTDEDSGMRPLLIDLANLDTGGGQGYPTVQGIIDEINRAYGVPQDKLELGNANNIQLVLNNDAIPGTQSQLNFDFQVDNISGRNADLYVENIQVLDENGVDITNVTQDVPAVALASTNTYSTTDGSNIVTVNTVGAHNFVVGQRVYLSPPAVAIAGISANDLGGYFTITGVSATGFNIAVNDVANATATHNQSNLEARPAYYTAETGTNARSTGAGTITSSIAGHTTSAFYTVKAKIAIADADGTVSTSEVTYRIDNLQSNTRNYRYAARAATDDGKIVTPNTLKPALVAKLVDANGNELPIINNRYTTAQQGFLKIEAGDSSYFVAIDSLDSQEQGQPTPGKVPDATNRGFAHFFELNNFFNSNRSDKPLDDTLGSAKNMSVSSFLTNNVNRISLGQMTQSAAPVDPTKPPLYTYERHFGDNSVITQLANFSTTVVSFAAAGDLGASQQTLGSYAGQMISTVSTKAASNQSDLANSKLLLDGFNERSDSARGVNLDEELANTVIYQNAYSASARIITVANQFFETLMDAVKV